MEQDSRSDESRERAVSSEPFSTRPNPFDDGELSARKRRRTSLTGSRSRSVETMPSQDQENSDAVPVSDSTMKVDTPEPAAPSTPPQSEALSEPPTTEPHSSKVTINLRNIDSLEATPTSPSSPTKRHLRDDLVKISVEESEVDMGQATPAEDDASSSTSEVNNSDVPVIAIDDDEDEDDELELVHAQPVPLVRSFGTNIDINSILMDFPYHVAEETYCDTVGRLVQFFQQPAQFDEALFQMRAWFDRYLSYAGSNAIPAEDILESSLENRLFWQSLPELFLQVYHRRSFLAKSRETRDYAGAFFARLARLAAHFLSMDCCRLQLVSTDEALNDLELISPDFLSCLGNITRKEENQLYNGYAADTIPEISELLDIFQNDATGSMIKLVRFTELQPSLLTRFPRRTMDQFAGVCNLAECIIRDSQQRLAHAPESSTIQATRAKKNLALALRLFNAVSTALDVVVDKSVNHLSADSATHLINFLTKILLGGLQGTSKDALESLGAHRENCPTIPAILIPETIANEWRYGLLSKLIRSRQMQLRVAAVAMMGNDLVCQWKKFQEPSDESQSMEYLRHFSRFLTSTGLIDYLLGPTCHPEITQESSNIIGFLVVTRTYEPAQTDLFWQTVTSTQDPRIAEALSRMLTKVMHLTHPEQLAYLNEKLHGLPIDAFTPPMRDLCENIVKNTLLKNTVNTIPATPYKLCIRLLQESSIYGSQGTISYPEIHIFAMGLFKDLIQPAVDPDIRQELLTSCMNDIAMKSTTAAGSLHALYVMIRSNLGPDLAMLVTEHDFARLLIDELEAAITIARKVGFTPVYAAQIGAARRDLVLHTIINHGAMIDAQHGRRLWDLLVGDRAACQEDRKMAWQQFNAASKGIRFENPFLRTCLQQHLPNLPPVFYCDGALEFVRQALLPLANDPSGTVLDDEDSADAAPIELLWQMILTAPAQSIELQAIHTLVNDVYVESRSIVSFPLHRARKVHFALVNRCLRQLAAAAEKLKAFSDGTTSGDDEPMIIVPTEEQQEGQELKFVRSLNVLRVFLKTLQGKSRFAAPDLRSLMLQSPTVVEGESAELKFQSFDGGKQTDVKPLSIGRQNTAASLLASLREATGFDNYRIFYRGGPLTPTEDQICKSLEDLNIHDGLILVKRESDVVSSPVKVKPGASPLEIEILGHFNELWEYLSMDEKLAREIYQFLVKLPADESILEAFENPATSYQDVFPLGESFKCLYTMHALREYLSTRRLKSQVMQVNTQNADSQQKTALDQEEAILKAISLLVAAICDPEVVDRCPGQTLQVLLSCHLVDNFVQLLKGTPVIESTTVLFMTDSDVPQDSMNAQAVVQLLSSNLQERLLAFLATATVTPSSASSMELINRSLEALLECCARNEEFWASFQQQPLAGKIIQNLLFNDGRPFVRKNVTSLISNKILLNQGKSEALALGFAEMFWPIVFELLPQAVMEPGKCEEVFSLSFTLMKRLAEANSPVLDMPICLSRCGQLLLSHTTVEDISHPERADIISHGLILILHYGIKFLSARDEPIRLSENFPRMLFYKHFFPPEDQDGPLVPQVVMSSAGRSKLCEIIYILSKDNPLQYQKLLEDLDELTPYKLHKPDQDPYNYDLPQQFDRLKAIRSYAGYPGLRNLSNTCYLNSLLTQLFMNAKFRRLMLETSIPNLETHQLLIETQSLFAALQDSVRRFIDPQQCVAQIMTYDETPIDIHNQMDVDEFYNLLFDRWEAQMPSEQAKKELRSIYGGQLVQQVKSKECEHISERMEPFSAIQCDIKGKSSLEESLQAYVDGEIMEGDNKYKCETCDRHVDAVKRACLKDIPDNLIFHLKRFDFNLRTLQRSKINDYFPFPTKIDMQPYTIEHLSDTSREAEPDVFELVGVLVHSGTAESGHYYSYIRERPSAGSHESWVEFNDDSVTEWNPAHMEGACFGGQNYHQPFDNGGIFDKVYSAYMLFYQRSSSLKREEESLQMTGNRFPLRFDLPDHVESYLKGDNWAVVQRHCLNEASHIPFVQRVLLDTWELECSDSHKTENLAMRVALGHLDQVVSRAKDTPEFELIYRPVSQMCQRCPRCCFCVFKYLQERPEAFRMLLQRNADQTIRQETGNLFIIVLNSIKQNLPDEYEVPEENGTYNQHDDVSVRRPCVLTAAVFLFRKLWDTFHTTLRAWPEYFGTMVDFANLGRAEAAALLEEDFLERLIMIIIADPSCELPPQYARMITTVSRRLPNRPPSYENIISLMDTLMNTMETKLGNRNLTEDASGRLQQGLDGELIPYTVAEVQMMYRDWDKVQSNMFVDKLILISQNQVSTESIINRLMEFNQTMDHKVFLTLRMGTTVQMLAQSIAPYLRAAASYVRVSSNAEGVSRLISHICYQCRSLQSTEGMAFFEFHKEIFDCSRRTEENFEMVMLSSLDLLPRWVPGLLGYIDRNVSYAVEMFLQQHLWQYGPSPNFGESAIGVQKARSMILAAKKLAIACLTYLQETYVQRGAQAPRDSVSPLDRTIKQCGPYFNNEEVVDDGTLDAQYVELCTATLEPMGRLTVDEIEDDASDWDGSIGSSDQMESLADLQAPGELHGDVH